MWSAENRSTFRVVLLTAVLALAASAHAIFPGKHGRIAFVQEGEIFTMNPEPKYDWKRKPAQIAALVRAPGDKP